MKTDAPAETERGQGILLQSLFKPFMFKKSEIRCV